MAVDECKIISILQYNGLYSIVKVAGFIAIPIEFDAIPNNIDSY
jgi:hypothetical protein